MSISPVEGTTVPSDVRKQARLLRDFDVVWAVESRRISGRGKLVDLSIGGACIQLDQDLSSGPNVTLSLVCSKIPVLPSRGQVKWVKQVKPGQPLYLYGLTFVHQNVPERWIDWLNTQT
jgi:hypothetical protein